MLGKFKDYLRKDTRKESDNEGKKSVEKMQKPKDEEEHVYSTLYTGN